MRAPIGYLDNGRGQLKTIDPLKGALVRELFERYSTGHYTLEKITEVMRAAGLTNTFGKPLGMNAVSGVLRNTFYTGLITLRSTGEAFVGAHEPLIPKSLFDRVQDVLSGKSRLKRHRHEFVFRRLVTCGLCGRVLIAERQKGHAYYRCHARGCPTTCVREERIEEAVSEQLARIELTAEELAECYEALSWLEGATESIAREETKRLSLEVAAVQDRLGRLTDLLIDGALDRDTYELKKRELLDRKLVLDEQLRRTADDPTWAVDEVREILELAKSPLLSFELAAPAEKRELIEITTSNRTVKGKEPSVELREAFKLIAERRSVLEGDPSRRLDRTVAQLSDVKAFPKFPRFAVTSNHVMVAELVMMARGSRGAILVR